MADPHQTGDLRGAEFTDANLTGARFTRADLSAVVMRAVDIDGADIDAPWLLAGGSLTVNSVDVAPFVEAELSRRFPGYADRRATTPDDLRAAWASLETTWAATVERAEAMPSGTVDISVDGEWSFAQTLRHLILATDIWFRKAILGIEQPLHPYGQPHAEYETDGNDMSVFDQEAPTYAQVLQVRAERAALVREFISGVSATELTQERRNPHDPAYPETVLSCLHTILEEEWEHHRYAVRDLDRIAARDTQ